MIPLEFQKGKELRQANRRLRILYTILAFIFAFLVLGMLGYLMLQGLEKSVSDYHCRYERVCEVK